MVRFRCRSPTGPRQLPGSHRRCRGRWVIRSWYASAVTCGKPRQACPTAFPDGVVPSAVRGPSADPRVGIGDRSGHRSSVWHRGIRGHGRVVGSGGPVLPPVSGRERLVVMMPRCGFHILPRLSVREPHRHRHAAPHRARWCVLAGQQACVPPRRVVGRPVDPPHPAAVRCHEIRSGERPHRIRTVRPGISEWPFRTVSRNGIVDSQYPFVTNFRHLPARLSVEWCETTLVRGAGCVAPGPIRLVRTRAGSSIRQHHTASPGRATEPVVVGPRRMVSRTAWLAEAVSRVRCVSRTPLRVPRIQFTHARTTPECVSPQLWTTRVDSACCGVFRADRSAVKCCLKTKRP
jgi:hypothetical protein